MTHDDGKKVDDIDSADVILLKSAELVRPQPPFILLTEVIKQ